MLFEQLVENICESLESPKLQVSGRLVRVIGMTLQAKGIKAPIGATCRIDGEDGKGFDAEVVGFQNDFLFLMPFSEPHGVSPGAKVTLFSSNAKVVVGQDQLGRILDGLGRPLDKKPQPISTTQLALQGTLVSPMDRKPIDHVLDVGVRAINGLLTVGRGQRLGLIAGSGVGKSVLLGMITKFTEADVVVIGLIGERGREVNEFVLNTLGSDGLAKSIVIVSPSNESPVLRLRATNFAHVVAEYWRDRGKNVLLLLDSLTRVAHAQREIGLAVGEPPTAKGYPPSVFAVLPKLIERSGPGREGIGSITAIYTVLAESDDRSDPIVDIARASLDGQVMLARSLADSAHYPAIDLMGSVSRVMNALVPPNILAQANKIRRLWTVYEQNKDLIQVGAYEKGSDPTIDEAIERRSEIEKFLRQDLASSSDLRSTQAMLSELAR